MVALLAAVPLGAAPRKEHAIVFGRALGVQLFIGPGETQGTPLAVRPLYVDARLKEFTTGDPHDVTDRTFVVRRVFRINDRLPDDPKAAPHWQWQRGGWLLVDRSTGHVGAINLPEFDPYYSVASWYRDYAAYCGVSDDGEKVYAVVTQLGRRKAILRREVGAVHGANLPDSECPAPDWQRNPVRVTFAPVGGQKLTFSVRGHAADVAEEDGQ